MNQQTKKLVYSRQNYCCSECGFRSWTDVLEPAFVRCFDSNEYTWEDRMEDWNYEIMCQRHLVKDADGWLVLPVIMHNKYKRRALERRPKGRLIHSSMVKYLTLDERREFSDLIQRGFEKPDGMINHFSKHESSRIKIADGRYAQQLRMLRNDASLVSKTKV